MRVYEDASRSIGNTPLVRLHKLDAGLKAKVIGKVEGRNPAYSVKCRIGAAMVWRGEEHGVSSSPAAPLSSRPRETPGSPSPMCARRAATGLSSLCRKR